MPPSFILQVDAAMTRKSRTGRTLCFGVSERRRWLLLPRLLVLTGCVGELGNRRAGGSAAARLPAGMLQPWVLRGAVLREASDVEMEASRREHQPRDSAVSTRGDVCRGHSDCAAGYFCPAGTQVCKECSFCNANGAAVDGRCPLECASAATAAQQESGPPALGWAFVDNRGTVPGSTVRTTPGERSWVDFYMYLNDMGYGISKAVMYFTSTTLSGEVFGIRAVVSAKGMAGKTSGVLKASFWFEYGDEAGRWGLRQLQLEDYVGNLRVYSDLDILLFGSKVNATLDIIGSEDRYVKCAKATKIRCSRNAECFDQCHSLDSRCFGKCACNPGYAGNEFACIKTEDLERYRVNNTVPSGFVVLKAEKTEIGSTISHGELAGRDPAGNPESSTASTPSSSPALSKGKSLKPEDMEPEGCLSHISCSAALFSGLFLAVSVATLVLLRVRIVFVDTIYAVRSHRHRQLRRVAAGLDDEDPRTQSRRMQAWSNGAEGFNTNGRTGALYSNRRDEDLLAWTTALSERDARPRPGGENMGGGGGRWRPAYIRPSQPPQEPAPISLPEHLLRVKMPGEVLEDVAEGQECAVCMEKRQDCKLLPCGHTDLCYGCAEHIFKHGGQCPVCRAKIVSVRCVRVS